MAGSVGTVVSRVTAHAPVRLERRLDVPAAWMRALTSVLAVALALIVVGVVLVVSGHNPITSYGEMADATVVNAKAWSQTLVSATPLLFTGLAASFAFRMKAWNIGGEGQLYAGAICATAAGVATGHAGLAASLPAMLVAGIAGGAIWAAAPGVLRARFGANEILTSLMLNYVAGLIMLYLIFNSNSYIRDLSSPTAHLFPLGKQIPGRAFWPGVGGGSLLVPLGFIVGIAVAAGLAVLVRRTKFGFQMKVIAESPRTARYSGMRDGRMFVIVMLVSGALAGLAGASQIGDFSHLLDPTGLQQAQYGYTGIVVAALGRFDPIGTVISALFLGAVTNAGLRLQGATFPQGLTGTIEGIILFVVLASELLLRYRVRFTRSGTHSSPTRAADDGAMAGSRDAPFDSARRPRGRAERAAGEAS